MPGPWILLPSEPEAHEMRRLAGYGCAKLTPAATWPWLIVSALFRHPKESCNVVFKSWKQTISTQSPQAKTRLPRQCPRIRCSTQPDGAAVHWEPNTNGPAEKSPGPFAESAR
jgi:hypothetical protein